MPTMRSGLFPVNGLPAAQLVRVRIFLLNTASQSARAGVEVNRLAGERKESIVSQEVAVEGERTEMLELDNVEGETIEVNVTTEDQGLIPGVAVVSIFTGDQSTSFQWWVSAGDFTPSPNALLTSV